MRVGVVGAAGRMGRVLIAAVHAHEGMTLGAATERAGADGVGADAGTLAGVGELGVAVADDASAFADCAAVLDFTSPAASTALVSQLAEMGVAHIVGTTGFSADEDAAFASAADRIAVVKSGNMSLGVNLLAALVRQAARALPDADIEVLEMHHRRKVDAPSGTALLLGNAAAEGRDVALADHAVMSREGHTGAREAGTIGFATLRGGTVIGDHEVILALDKERVTLGHRAEDRTIYASGALTAALWTEGRGPGLYTMADVLGIG
ncbi:4-hydroxy-tetrahydrodipicolinate reductase [Acuticoccus sp. MNP-M23]|uniref:4-hydroxy-tetrahydrodipicolinate reductase n=1 Tax=Acuticoccus sp. MNP-M23 TaxID=3072793 RepID=UPI0028158035|nr:4-hydroxy-tetrahydrodipicolinate reductase [Acuticoccus sp. MNP-M23]WMS44989.1 4-hydroxy-tetrahydrodipicolinate reductase [Acuticoccus sp. MNP-M23]